MHVNQKNDFTVSANLLIMFIFSVFVVYLFLPEIVHAAVGFGQMGQNVAENAKGVAKGITLAGFCAGAGMGVWGCVDMYKAVKGQGQSTYAGGLTKLMVGALLLGLGELLGSGSMTLFGTDQTTGFDDLGL